MPVCCMIRRQDHELYRTSATGRRNKINTPKKKNGQRGLILVTKNTQETVETYGREVESRSQHTYAAVQDNLDLMLYIFVEIT